MNSARIVALVTELAAADPATCDRRGLADLVATSQQVRSWLDALDVRIALAARRLADDGACEAPSSLLTGGGRRAARDAEQAARRSEVCDLLPEMHDALAAGAVSAGHADALVGVVKDLDERGRSDLKELAPALVDAATSSSVEVFGREVRKLGQILSRDDGVRRHEHLRRQRCVRRWVDRITGLCHTDLVLDPLTDAAVAKALGDAVNAEQAKGADDRTLDQIKADALVGLITGRHSARGVFAEALVLIDVDTLRDGLQDASVSETSTGQPVPVETVRRLCCEADIIPVVLDGDGVVLDVGRARRVATREQRQALRAMYRTCGHPGCTVGFDDCDIHHVSPWVPNGLTDLDNLLPLCSRHHHAVHEGGWTLTLAADRTIALRRPDGTLHHDGSTVDVAPTGVAPGDTSEHPADDERRLELLDELDQTPAEVAELAAHARARVRALGPPSRAPAA
jgi:hypothetical protein